MRNKIIILFLLVFTLVLAPLTLAHTGEEVEGVHEEALFGVPQNTEDEGKLPANLQKVVEYNNEQAKFYLKNLSFLIAFLAGIIGLLTPCSLAILPAFFAYSFKEKKQITKMTLVFFLGFTPVFVAFGLIASFLGKSFAIYQQSNDTLIFVAGILIIIFGFMALFGKGFAGININKKSDTSTWGVFLFGILFAIGFTACMGPILIGILLIAGTLQNYFYAGFLMFFYSLGLFVPLFLISIFFDKYNFSRFMNKTNKKLGFPLSNLISGILLIGMGVLFLIFKGTLFLDGLGLGNLTIFIYSIQTKILSMNFINVIGVVVLGGFLYLVWRTLKRRKVKE